MEVLQGAFYQQKAQLEAFSVIVKTLPMALDLHNSVHSLSEWGFEILKTYQAPAHIWDLPRWWKLLLLMYKIFDMRTFGLSHQIIGPATVKVAKTGSNCINCKKANFTVVGPLIWCDNPKVRMSKILYIHNNDFHHLGRSQICAGAWYVFGTWKPHSETLCAGICGLR